MQSFFSRMSFPGLMRTLVLLMAVFSLLCGLLAAYPLHLYLETQKKGGMPAIAIAVGLIVSLTVFSLVYRFGQLRRLHRIGGSDGG